MFLCKDRNSAHCTSSLSFTTMYEHIHVLVAICKIKSGVQLFDGRRMVVGGGDAKDRISPINLGRNMSFV